jgi:predicted RNA methylase
MLTLMDRYYTPTALAEAIIDKLPDMDPTLAADFAAGEGALLNAVRRRWPRCKLLATDIDPTAVRNLKAELSRSHVGTCDFFNEKSRRRSPVLNGRSKGVPLIFLNPPFSSRGERIALKFEETALQCSRALAFTAVALDYLSSEGRLIALLPSSCFTSEKDAHALRTINQSYIVKILSVSEPARFVGCTIDVVVAQFQRRKTKLRVSPNPSNVHRLDTGTKLHLRVSLVRGRVSMPNASSYQVKRGFPLVHTTSLQKQAVVFDKGQVSRRLEAHSGPIVLISRVGKPQVDKLCLYDGSKPIVLSECIIAVKGDTAKATRSVHALLHAQSRLLLQCYVGSCAKYLTVGRLSDFLKDFGISVVCLDKLDERKEKAA